VEFRRRDAHVDALGASLVEHFGVKKGDRVAIADAQPARVGVFVRQRRLSVGAISVPR